MPANEQGAASSHDRCRAAGVCTCEREAGWYIVNHDRDDEVLRGPYDSASTAGAVRTEMKRGDRYDDANLWIVPASFWEAE